MRESTRACHTEVSTPHAVPAYEPRLTLPSRCPAFEGPLGEHAIVIDHEHVFAPFYNDNIRTITRRLSCPARRTTLGFFIATGLWFGQAVTGNPVKHRHKLVEYVPR